MPDLTAPESSSDERDTAPPPSPTARPASDVPIPVYGARYFDSYTSGAYEFDGEWAAFFTSVADHIVRQFRPATVLDAGCAKGFLVHALRERGVDAYGIDVSEYAVANALEPVRPFVRVGSIAEPLDRRYDLIACIETIEHLRGAEVRPAIDSLCAATDVVLLSSTGNGEHYGEPSHISMHPPEDWASLFAEHGHLRDLNVDVSWLTPWAMVLKKEPALTVPEVVRAYDRHVARLQREAFELRRSALALEREIEERSAPRPDAKLVEELERLRRNEERAVAAQTEALRLRDLLIVAERAAGQLRGEIARLNDQLSGYDELAEHHHAMVNSTTWRLVWKLLGPYRRARQRVGL